MKEPAFWRLPPHRFSLASRALSVLSPLYAAATRKKVNETGYRAQVPVICVGNINAGGTGKTPTVIAMVQRLLDRGYTPHVVSRGYGGKLVGPLSVDPSKHSAADVGDEPLLIAAFVPVTVAKNRAAGVQHAEHLGADVIVLDDGLQHGKVARDANIIVVDATRGFGNGRVIPAGPLREPVATGMARGDVLISIGNDTAQQQFSDNWAGLVSIPRIRAQLEPLQTGMDWAGLNVLAFAGIGHPEKFFATLKTLGATLLRAEALADHQPLSLQLMKRLEVDALTMGAQMVTTEKDAVRLPASFRQKVITLPVRLEPEDWAQIDAMLRRIGLE